MSRLVFHFSVSVRLSVSSAPERGMNRDDVQASTGRTLSRLSMDTSTSSELNSASLTRRKRLYFRNVHQRIELITNRLHYNFVEAASGGSNFDMRKIFDGSLVQFRPQDAVTLVNNHE